jgi:hypothetical protein
MKRHALGFFALVMFACAALTSAEPTANQITGSLVAITDTTLTILNGNERQEVARTADTKGTHSLKVGDKITVTYTITPSNAKMATNVDLKADKEARAEDPSATVFPPKK